ncbi:MAG: DUF3837 domain-containing protein [Roseburia sp.]|nr:DUF3837 domain-containing protein [Roseburia sp.]
MTTSIARQSVIIKCNMNRAYILGNYEFYYAAGLAGKLYGFEVPDDVQPEELADLLASQLEQAVPNNEQEKYLLFILKEYEPENRYDEQMKELLLWGKKETCPWQVSVS